MSEPQPKRRWWRKKTLWAAVVLLLPLFVYPLSIGPLCYAASRGWLAGGPYYAPYRPIFWLAERGPEPWATYTLNYLLWWQELGARHNGETP